VRVLVAPDSFKGSLEAPTVAQAIGRGLERAGLPAPDLCPLADGGEGTLDVLLGALGGRVRVTTATDPLGRAVPARFGELEGGAGLVEVAEATGLARVVEEERDAHAASSRGTGELVLAAAQAGADPVIVAAGGSASTDGGAGALAAIQEGGGIDGVRLVVLCDVRTPWEQAAARFGPQKGADPATVRRLQRRLERLAERLPRDPRGRALTGAAGGLAGGLWAAHQAELHPGAAWILAALGFDARLRAARAVVVGEGRLDRTTLEGKLVFEVCTRARQIGVPSHAIVGEDALDLFDRRILDLQAVLEAGTTEALERAGQKLADVL
jgi:glycerate kinase